MDHEEALRLSGQKDVPSAIAFFREKGTGAVVVTNGAQNIYLWADSPLFGKVEEQTMPVSKAVGEALDGLPLIKIHCSLLAEEAIKAAIYDYSKKKNITIEGLEKPKKDID